MKNASNVEVLTDILPVELDLEKEQRRISPWKQSRTDREWKNRRDGLDFCHLEEWYNGAMHGHIVSPSRSQRNLNLVLLPCSYSDAIFREDKQDTPRQPGRVIPFDFIQREKNVTLSQTPILSIFCMIESGNKCGSECFKYVYDIRCDYRILTLRMGITLRNVESIE